MKNKRTSSLMKVVTMILLVASIGLIAASACVKQKNMLLQKISTSQN